MSNAEPQSFSEDILPIFKGRCVSCHQPGGAGYEKSGLDLTTYEGLMKGTKFGAMVIPRDPESSNLMWLLDWRASPEVRMPHGKKKLSMCDRNAIRAWIREGAKNN
jgi:mono/diheme cytochrome c family protein